MKETVFCPLQKCRIMASCVYSINTSWTQGIAGQKSGSLKPEHGRISGTDNALIVNAKSAVKISCLFKSVKNRLVDFVIKLVNERKQ